ncbi:MAG: M28 family peptidase [Anaerolineae bacterium]|nr:M28 family peptidase [Anaerolineae bacterium]
MAGFLGFVRRALDPRADLSRLPSASQEEERRAPRRSRLRARDILHNGPLLLGGAIVLGLFLVVLFGPIWAPENPYLSGQRTITYEDGKIVAPPFPPSERFPLGTDQWGRDTLSLLLYGTRNTLVACVFITMARFLLGLVLGAVAGWNEGSLADRAILGAITLTTALPALITSMLLIYALDIRRGLPVFIVALSLVGWGELAQYIRAEFLVLRRKPFIEGARVLGLRGGAIAVRHVLPNILPQLVVYTLLETGAVLMLLGELGFVGVYIGGGLRTEGVSGRGITIPDIPEWGAMMADSRRWARAKPWMVFWPAAAFFVAVVGFNALGEGLRRLVEQGGFHTGFLLSKRMLLVVVLVTVATVYVVQNVGPAPSYARLAEEFRGEEAYRHVQTLVGLRGRGNGTPDAQAAAEYIAQQFEAYGLQPAGEGLSYFQEVPALLVHPLEQPVLALLDEAGRVQQAFRHQLDFGYLTEGHAGSGTAQAPLAFVGFHRGRGDLSWADYKGMDLRGRIVLLMEGNAPRDFPTEALIRGAAGVLWVTGDRPEDVRSQAQLTGDPDEYLRRPTLPVFRIRRQVAEALVAPAGLHLEDLEARLQEEPTGEGPWFVQDLAAQVRMAVSLSPPQEVALVHVLGSITGKDIALDEEVVIVGAHYDGLGTDPDGTIFPAANDDASGVGVLLEVARLWHERHMDPRRTVVFAAWAGGVLDAGGPVAYFDAPAGGISYLQTVAVFQLDNLGAGDEVLLVNPGSRRLADVMVASAREAGLAVREDPTVYHPYQGQVKARVPSVLVSWANSWRPPDEDALARIRPERLRAAGEAVNLALIRVSREPSF